ncbi:hypothetical protein BDM02DRAFT_2734925 [Thelephora ganbajun]|uniref:Uncharacterized protein n=1 Tax=Thelephora ganbajun TaxID=370292 RepID=A0ACB6ZCB0_THEGA|nr:hypothetical protein BDM02DRAFT_2734925 [Thelephora ganbajun]
MAELTMTMKPSRPGPLSKFRAARSDAKQASYTLWFTCKRLNRKMKRALGISKAGSARLPQEIVNCIVDYISEDRATLFACTHLSRTWCIAARAHLHRTFTVLDSAGFGVADNLQRMGMAHLVRKIVVARQINQTDFMLPETMTRLHAFTHLQELDIRYLDVGKPLCWLYEHCDILKSTVRTLTLRYPRGSIKQLFCFVSLFSSLENLTVDSIDIDFTPDAFVPVLGSSPPLTGRLTLTGIFDQEFISGLVSLQKGIKFRTVDLQFCGEVQEIVDACAGTMERFICHPSDFRDIQNLNLSRCDSLRHVEVNFHSIVRAYPNHPFHDFISAIPSPQLETCLILNYDNDLDELKKTLQVPPKPKSKSTSKKEKEKEKEKPKRGVKITFGLDIEKEGVEDHRAIIRTALDRAIGNGVFEFLTKTPVLEVYPRVWSITA